MEGAAVDMRVAAEATAAADTAKQLLEPLKAPDRNPGLFSFGPGAKP